MRVWLGLLVGSVLCWGAITNADEPSAEPEEKTWHGQLAAGLDYVVEPEFAGFGFFLFQATGQGIVGGGDLRLYYNTDTVEVGLDRIPLAKNLDLFIALRGEAFFSGLLRYYYVGGIRNTNFGFNASYIILRNKLQWHFAPKHTFEVIADVRHWWFGDDDTSPDFVLPDDTWVFEPRIGYIFWNVDSPGGEWTADKLFPRFEGNAFGLTVGIDVRSDINTWGLDDGRNDPTKAILTVNQWYRGGWQFKPFFRLEVQETANWGENQDDISRQRVGGMNPYSIVVPGVPWAGILSERLLIGQASAHFRVKKNKPQELGVLISGGTVNDPFRTGNLDSFGGIGGVAVMTDLRWGPVSLYARVGYAIPTNWLADEAFISVFGGIGVDAF
ncbi:MAG: hypothetical protein AAF500_04560 [Myxococcota bacterium]